MGALTSRAWQEMTELQQAEHDRLQQQQQPQPVNLDAAATATTEETKGSRSFRNKLRTRILRTDPRSATDGMDRTPIAVSKTNQNTDTPVETKMKTLSIDPRSPGGVDRTPIVVEESVRRRVLDDECSTPVRGQGPPVIALADRSPFIIETEENSVESKSASQENSDDPLTSTPSSLAIDLIHRERLEHSTPQTIDLNKLAEQQSSTSSSSAVAGVRRTDKGQPSKILQDRLRSAVANLQEHDPDGELSACTPAAAGDLDDSEASFKSGNDSSIVI